MAVITSVCPATIVCLMLKTILKGDPLRLKRNDDNGAAGKGVCSPNYNDHRLEVHQTE